MKFSQAVTWVFLIGAGMGVFCGCTTYNAATGRNEFIFISTQEEVSLGEKTHAELTEKYSFSTQSAYLSRVRSIGEKIVLVSDRQDYIYQFYVIKSDELNAFTTPGGKIYVYTGLLDRMKKDEEIAFVLAHEIGHCAARHVVKKFQAALGYNLLGSIVLSQIEGSGAGVSAQAVNMSAGVLSNLVFSAYGRQDELQADSLGLKYMILAGYDPQGAVDALAVLEAGSKGPDIPEILRTHPHLEKRIQQVKAIMPDMIRQYGK